MLKIRKKAEVEVMIKSVIHDAFKSLNTRKNYRKLVWKFGCVLMYTQKEVGMSVRERDEYSGTGCFKDNSRP